MGGGGEKLGLSTASLSVELLSYRRKIWLDYKGIESIQTLKNAAQE